jgi:hypothetical protein
MNKKVITVSVLIGSLFMFFITSCEKEKPLSELIVGKWKVQTIQQVNYENNVKVSETTIFLKTDEYAMQFVEGGSGIQYQDGQAAGVFEWVLTGSIIRITAGNYIYDWTVTVDNNTLVWTYTDSEVVNGTTNKYEFFYTATRGN